MIQSEIYLADKGLNESGRTNKCYKKFYDQENLCLDWTQRMTFLTRNFQDCIEKGLFPSRNLVFIKKFCVWNYLTYKRRPLNFSRFLCLNNGRVSITPLPNPKAIKNSLHYKTFQSHIACKANTQKRSRIFDNSHLG